MSSANSDQRQGRTPRPPKDERTRPGVNGLAREVSYGRIVLLGFGFLSITMAWSLFNAYVPIFLREFLPSSALVGVVMSLDNVAGVTLILVLVLLLIVARAPAPADPAPAATPPVGLWGAVRALPRADGRARRDRHVDGPVLPRDVAGRQRGPAPCRLSDGPPGQLLPIWLQCGSLHRGAFLRQPLDS